MYEVILCRWNISLILIIATIGYLSSYPGPYMQNGSTWFIILTSLLSTMITFILVYCLHFTHIVSAYDLTSLSPPVKYFTDRSKAVLLLWIFYVFVLSCVCYVLCVSVYMCFVVTCWERADLLAFVCGVFCEFVTFPLVSWVRCGTWLYRFLIFATLLLWTPSKSSMVFLSIS